MQPPQLDGLLKFLTDTLQQGKDFSMEQAPLFVRELLMWRFYEAAFWCGVGVVIILAGFVAAQFFARCVADDEDERRIAYWVPPLIAIAIGSLVIGSNVYTMVQIRVAPRVVLVETVRDIIAGPRR